MLDLFSDMARDVLATLGEAALFDGAAQPVQLHIEQGVRMEGMGGRGDLITVRDVCTLESSHNPKSGQKFTQNGKRWKLEHLVDDNGAVRRFTILAIP